MKTNKKRQRSLRLSSQKILRVLKPAVAVRAQTTERWFPAALPENVSDPLLQRSLLQLKPLFESLTVMYQFDFVTLKK